MKFLIQRTSSATVKADNEITGQIGKGLLIFIGIRDSDTEETADKMLKKAYNLRIFSDNEGKTNLSLCDVNGGLLLISQFTLYANCKKGNRPSFFEAGSPEHAEKLYNYIVNKAKEYCSTVETGRFGADMEVSLENDGPFTIMLDSEEL
ncbi:MAG: D-aminoacyl-tRNA deacylase [Lachnospiraceae bacterium]|nr:D-aminoacyl-tRNA deacylase [Lachnospiraceae bacterium]